MTSREFFERVAKEESLAEDLRNYALNAKEKLDKRNAERREKPSKTALENAPIKAAIVEYLRGKSNEIASVIAENVGISTAKASSLCGQLVAEGKVVVTDVKIKGKGKVKGYTLVEENTEEVTE